MTEAGMDDIGGEPFGRIADAGDGFRAIDVGDRPTRALAPQPAPMLDWVAIDRMVIDGAYQRPLERRNWIAIERIADAFSWAHFGPVLLAPLPGGRFAVVDGQHRVHAALLCGVERVPAMIIPIDRRDQARAFGAVNGQVTAVSRQALFRARLAAGDDLACRTDALVTQAGCRILHYNPSAANRRAGELLCVGLLERIVARGDGAALRLVLSGLIRSPEGAHGTECWGEGLIGPAVAAVAAQTRMPGDPAAFFTRNPPSRVRRAAEAQRASGAPGYETASKALTRALSVLLAAEARAA